MKYPLVALVALGAAAGACAQTSQVSLFGVLDASLARISSGGSSVTGLSNGGLASSRLGFRGTEDLGGGLQAGFWLEGGLGVDTGTAAGLQFDRRSTVGLQGGFGEVRLGRDKVPAYLNIETFDAFGDVGVGGINGANLIGNAKVAVGTADGSGPKRASNSLNYLLPKLGGFYGQVQYALGEEPSTTANDKLRSSSSLRLGYASGPLDVALGWGTVTGGTATAAVDYKATNIGASYDFGVVKPMVLFATESGAGRRVDLFGLGATVPLGVGQLRVAYSQFKSKDVANADSSKFAIGYVYALSKRTAVYGTLSRLSNDAKATRGLAVSSSALASPTIAAGASVSGFEAGLRHSF